MEVAVEPVEAVVVVTVASLTPEVVAVAVVEATQRSPLT